MLSWYLITYNSHALKRVVLCIRGLGVEVFSPSKIKISHRANCSGVRTTETALFPGYLFIRLDPDDVHTSSILQITGVKDFVRIGEKICTVSNGLIEALRESLILRIDPKVTQLEYRNVSPEVVSTLEQIALLRCQVARQSALFDLLQKDEMLISRANSSYSRIVSVIEKPYVNDLIN